MDDIERKILVDESERKAHFVVVQDVEPIIENNKRLQSIEQKSDWGRHIASIPNVIINQWLQAEWDRGNTSMTLSSPEFNAIIAAKLRDRDWMFLRTDNI